MIQITDRARVKLLESVREHGENPAVRIYVAGSGWGGPSWGLALDEPSAEDEVRAEDGFRLIMNRGLLNQMGGVQVDYLSGPFRRGFNVKAASQGGDCSSGSCSC